jgi:hypothetical protein
MYQWLYHVRRNGYCYRDLRLSLLSVHDMPSFGFLLPDGFATLE